jgi:hypothetical protein
LGYDGNVDSLVHPIETLLDFDAYLRSRHARSNKARTWWCSISWPKTFVDMNGFAKAQPPFAPPCLAIADQSSLTFRRATTSARILIHTRPRSFFDKGKDIGLDSTPHAASRASCSPAIDGTGAAARVRKRQNQTLPPSLTKSMKPPRPL